MMPVRYELARPRSWVSGPMAAILAAVALMSGAESVTAQTAGPRGFHLGQARADVAEAAGRALEPGRCAITRVDGTDYRFRFTPAGRLYRVETRRDLGPDEFTERGRADFLRRMAAEHGPPDVAESHSGYVRAIWGLRGGIRRIIKLAPASPDTPTSPLIMRENLFDPTLLEQDREAAASTGATPTFGERFLSDPGPPRTACRGRLTASRAAK